MEKTVTKLYMFPAAFAATLFLVAPALAYVGAVPPLPAFFAWVASLVPAVIAIIVGLRLSTRRSPRLGRLSMALGVLPLVTIGYGIAVTSGYPPINDIATNLENPPQLTVAANAPENAGASLEYPNLYRDAVRAAYPDLISLQLPMPAPEAFALAERVARDDSRLVVTRVDSEPMTLEGHETTKVFHFTDDFVVRVLPLDASSQIDMRSRSRLGRADFGANAARIRRYFAALSASAGLAAEPDPSK